MPFIKHFILFIYLLKAYIACKPKKGSKLGWGCWVLFALTIYQIILLALHFLDKPNGLVRYESGKLIKDEPKPLKRAQSGSYSASTSTKSASASVSVSGSASTKKANPPPQQPSRGGNSNREASVSVQMEAQYQQRQEKKKKDMPQLPKRPGYGRRKLIAAYDCTADQEGDLSFNKGDIIYFVSDEPGEGWMTGEINGVQGIFPVNYVNDA